MGPIGAVLILLIIFGSLTAVILGIVMLTNKNKERMAIISKGADPLLFKDEYMRYSNLPLVIGIFLIGIAIGIVAGNLLYYNVNAFQNEAASYFFSILFFGGVSLMLAAYIDRRKKKSGK
ncbi:MAG: hypothetical protein JW723_02405 [Bacteroidales bacterium]|nr:hypothetical protein [Bacteroidales bacterium]